MGSFEISCNGTVLFSKLSLGYLPHVPSASSRILSFIDDYRNKRDLKKYAEGKTISPQKQGITFNKSPGKKLKYSPDYK